MNCRQSSARAIRRIFVLCQSHLDIGFTRPTDEVARDYKDNIDGYFLLVGYYQAKARALFRGSAPAATIPFAASDRIAALLPIE